MLIKEYKNLFKTYPLIILTLGFAYGATIVFTFFGPILIKISGDNAATLSIFAVTSHVVGFFLKPNKVERQIKFFYIYIAILLPLILFFYRMPYYFQIIVTILYPYMIGRIGCFWTYKANHLIPSSKRGKLISASLLISFIILYFTNMLIPLFSEKASLILPGILSSLTVFLYSKIDKKYYNSNSVNDEIITKKSTAYFMFLFLIVIYIAGGVTYNGIYPSFKPYEYIDRYYNVFFYIISIVIAGFILDRYGRKIAFLIGVSFLGISFTFFTMPSSVTTYFVTQTFLQAGWAFVNSFGWSFSWDMARDSNKDLLFPRGIASMLLGAAIGGFLAKLLRSSGASNYIYGIVTFVPLFISIILLSFFPETLVLSKDNKIDLNKLQQIDELKVLTPRELEVYYHMVLGLNNKMISKELFISENTVKTHISHIYNKLDISNRNQLKKYI